MDKKRAKAEKKYILQRINEIYKAYAIDEDDEEVACVYMLFKHKNGETQTKCLRFFNIDESHNSGDTYEELGLIYTTNYVPDSEDKGLDLLWEWINEQVNKGN